MAPAALITLAAEIVRVSGKAARWEKRAMTAKNPGAFKRPAAEMRKTLESARAALDGKDPAAIEVAIMELLEYNDSD